MISVERMSLFRCSLFNDDCLFLVLFCIRVSLSFVQCDSIDAENKERNIANYVKALKKLGKLVTEDTIFTINTHICEGFVLMNIYDSLYYTRRECYLKRNGYTCHTCTSTRVCVHMHMHMCTNGTVVLCRVVR